jgi:RNA polymerase sigma-70 factor (ECF subfamily)
MELVKPDRSTFEKLVADHHAAVYRSARRVLRGDDAAADVTQQVFLRLLEGRSALRADADAGRVLCWLATRLALNELRGSRRRNRTEGSATMQPDRTGSSPAVAAADHEERRCLGRVLDELPDELRVAVVLRFAEGLTFAAVGRALSLSESTVHDRVQRGLARLRQRLRDAGFALAPARIGELLSSAAPAAVPPALPGALLALTPRAGLLAGAAGKLAAAAVLVVGAAGGALALAGGGAPPSARETVALGAAGGVQSPERQDPPPVRQPLREPERAPPLAAPARSATLAGRVRDAGGWPLEAAHIRARSSDSAKAPRFQRAAATDRAGRFVLDLPLPDGAAQHGYVLQVEAGGRVLLESEEIVVRAAGDNPTAELLLPESAGRAEHRWSLAVTVVDAAGAARAGVPVGVWADAGKALGRAAPEVHGTTDAGGVALLEGMVPGAKLLGVDGREHGGRYLIEPLAIDQPRALQRRIAMPAGLQLAGSVACIDGSVPEFVSLHLVHEATGIAAWAQADATGRFSFPGLGEGPYVLTAGGNELSAARIAGLAAGGAPMELVLKREDDERDVGTHMAELHGVLRDARSGADVPVELWDVDTIEMFEGESTLPFDLLETEGLIAQRAAQARPPQPRFHATGLDAGRHALLVRKRGFAPALVAFDLRAGEMRTDVVVELQEAARIPGRLITDAGAPIAGAQVFVLGVGATADRHLGAWDEAARADERARGDPSVLAALARTDADGRFALRDVPPGYELRVVAVHAGHQPAVSRALRLAAGERAAAIELRALPQ